LEEEATVDKKMDASTKARLVSIRGWHGYNNPWMLEDDSDVDYINLLMNPERYTGYKACISQNTACIWKFSCSKWLWPL
jgi:ERO1-like protein alpha